MERGGGGGNFQAGSGTRTGACPRLMQPGQEGFEGYKVSALQCALLQLPPHLAGVCVEQAGWEGSKICFCLTLGRKAGKPVGFCHSWDLSMKRNVKAIGVKKEFCYCESPRGIPQALETNTSLLQGSCKKDVRILH